MSITADMVVLFRFGHTTMSAVFRLPFRNSGHHGV